MDNRLKILTLVAIILGACAHAPHPEKSQNSDVEKTLIQNRPAFDLCAKRAKRVEHKTPHGGLSFDYTIGALGKLTDVKITDNSTGSRTLENCLQTTLRALVFYPPAQGETLSGNYSLEF